MSYEKVKQAKKTIIGIKQTVKAIQAGKVAEVIIAQDIEERITQQLLEVTNEYSIPVTYVASRKQLGEASGIAVGTTVVAITE
ncbi:ribosomal L7Ae/L30e/S12e/Gadd45 family protein [Sporosarcina ureilytica]|uniref:Ribosomal protein L7Ae-like protein n=1 Tax=Sporosarcina ureilytica TaxID=298596 RepID=A0A1D8JCT2_9BACL|nr:ribosomal L7Ae/L30e/S12e/Gadd45 family protein [Sporosarcina ureilytica]AOV06511.1 ribosomal protein L7Ae-like protein [Sporosarcina ureilytica]